MSPKYCVYCGSPTKETDKFCIVCGKPLLTDIPKPDKKAEVKDVYASEQDVKKEVEELQTEKNDLVLDDDEKEKKKKKSTKEKDNYNVQSLPDAVKQQLTYYVEFTDIQVNKKVLIDKLNELANSTKDSRYEYDFDFKKEINVKLEAVKTLISEYKQKEIEIKQNLEEPFIVQRINSNIETKVFQLENLSREHKLHKVDKETFQKLKEKYKEEKYELETERKELISGMKLWIQELKLEKAELSVERKLNKGRFHAKEISEDQFKEKEKDFEIRSKKTDSKIGTLEKLTK